MSLDDIRIVPSPTRIKVSGKHDKAVEIAKQKSAINLNKNILPVQDVVTPAPAKATPQNYVIPEQKPERGELTARDAARHAAAAPYREQSVAQIMVGQVWTPQEHTELFNTIGKGRFTVISINAVAVQFVNSEDLEAGSMTDVNAMALSVFQKEFKIEEV